MADCSDIVLFVGASFFANALASNPSSIKRILLYFNSDRYVKTEE